MAGPLSKVSKVAKAASKAAAKAQTKTYKTADGYTFYELPNGSIVDNLKPSKVDMSWPSRQEFLSDMEGTAYEAGDELGQRRAIAESYGVPTQERLIENITKFGEDDISNFYAARKKQIEDAERRAKLFVIPSAPKMDPQEFQRFAEKGMIRWAKDQDQEMKDFLAGKSKFAELYLNWDDPSTYELIDSLESQGFKSTVSQRGPSNVTYLYREPEDVELILRAQNPAQYGKAYGYSDEDIARFYWERGLGPGRYAEDMATVPKPDEDKAKGGAVDHDLKEWYEKNMAKGGKVSEESKESRPSPPNPELLKYMSLDDLVNPLVNFPKRYPGQTVALPSDSASDYNKEVQDRRLKQGAIDAVDWATKNLPQPVNPVMQSLRNILDMRKRKHGGFHPDVREAAGLVDVPEELIPIEDKKSYTPRFNHGGEVHMQGGGDLRAQVERQLAAGVPVFADRGVQGQIAKQILDEQEAARLKEEEDRRARIESLPFSDRLAGRAEAARTLGSAVGRSMVAPYVAVAKGEEAAKQFAEDVPIPKTEAGAYYTGTAAEMLEGPAKFMQAAKIPDTPLTELVPTQYLPGLGRQLSGIAAKAARGVDAAIPDELKGLPVGGSIQPVGPGGEKLSVNELIRRLEAGEEMTPEQRQRAEYSKAQKEKYAQANIAKAQKEPAPKEELVKVPANEQGFFSSVEKAAANLKREEGSGDAFLSDIMKFNPSAGELEAIGIVQFLKGKKNVTRQEVNDFINQNKVEIEEVIRGRDILTESERTKLNEIERALSKGWYDIPEQDLDWYESTKQRLLATPAARFDREGLVLPNGTNYKEILLKLPQSKSQPEIMYKTGSDLREKINEFEALGFRPDAIEEAAKFIDQRGSVESALKAQDSKIAKGYGYTQSEKDAGQVLRAILQGHKKQIDEVEKSTFRTQHWPDDPNTLAHIRMQDMKIGGKKTLVIEEIQSDWHQEGRKKGYQKSDIEDSDLMNKLKNQYDIAVKKRRELYRLIETRDDADPKITMAAIEAGDLTDELVRLSDEMTEIRSRQKQGVPDAPFKKDWYQLAMKRVMKYAADNDYDQIALVGPDEQIRRGSLGTHIDGLIYEKNADGTIKLMAEKGESVVLDKTVEPKDLDLYVGKDVAKRILESKETDGTLTGDDLKIGGEGMRQYYGRNYPEYMNKLGRDYGTEAKKTNFVIKEFEPDDVEEVYTGEADRYGREIIAYKVVDRETGDEVAFEYDFDKALKEANKKAPSTDMWLMDLPAKMKADVKVGQPFAKGGAVTKDKNLIRWQKLQEFARGGTVQKLAKVAEKVGKTAKRMSREEAEKAGLYHDISGIKLKKPLADVKVVIVDDPKAKMQERVEITPEALYGGASVPMFGDRSDVGKIVKEIEGVPMDVVLEGGGEFMRKHPKHIWASHPDRLEALAKKVRMAGESGRPVYGVHSAMGPQSVDFSTMVTEAIMAGLDLGSLRKEDISAFNQAVKSVKGQGGKPKAPNFPGLEDPELFQKLMSGPGGQRDAFLKAMDKRQFQEAGFPSVAEARYAVTAPRLLDVERGASGYAVGEFDPAGVIEVLSGHKSYPADIRGQYKGALPTLLPVEIMYPTHYGARRMLGATHDAAIKSIESQLPIQYHDQEWLDNAMKYLEMQKKLTGQKKGGLASLKKIRNSRNG